MLSPEPFGFLINLDVKFADFGAVDFRESCVPFVRVKGGQRFVIKETVSMTIKRVTTTD